MVVTSVSKSQRKSQRRTFCHRILWPRVIFADRCEFASENFPEAFDFHYVLPSIKGSLKTELRKIYTTAKRFSKKTVTAFSPAGKLIVIIISGV